MTEEAGAGEGLPHHRKQNGHKNYFSSETTQPGEGETNITEATVAGICKAGYGEKAVTQRKSSRNLHGRSLETRAEYESAGKALRGRSEKNAGKEIIR